MNIKVFCLYVWPFQYKGRQFKPVYTQWLSCGVKVVPKNGTIKQIKMLCSLFGTVRLSIFIPLINIY